ncbi:FecR family protein [Maribacter vaceletii]|uniref:FecR family protein n=1 Tax=Maribacter vaceletii TaxID=1206816 RepID=A0A495E9B0_9FLAO|nr:FecR family protein [Maribacter vaceletii]RKR13169.1 FecR family protein [Maribacter vaceletii]
MNKRQVKNLFKKYINEECTKQERALLDNYLESFQDKQILLRDLNYDTEMKDKIWKKIISESTQDEKVNKYSFINYIKYAAIITVIISVSFWFINSKSSTAESNSELIIAEQAIILKTSDSEKVIIDIENQQNLVAKGQVVGKQNGATINYLNNKTVTDLVYNEISIPYGRTFNLTLSDGTMVHLNAGTTMKYPVNFIKGKEREIFLKGEAYFEVAKDKEHPFIVNTNDIGVRVLGTHFNVNSYKNTDSYAVLAEGSVVVYKQLLKSDLETHIKIVPGQKASLLKENITVKNIDIDKYLGWRNGRLLFDNEEFKDVVKKIERKYNVKIENEYSKLNNLKFKGDFEDESIIDLLDTFKESARFNYEIIDNKIIIKKPI